MIIYKLAYDLLEQFSWNTKQRYWSKISRVQSIPFSKIGITEDSFHCWGNLQQSLLFLKTSNKPWIRDLCASLRSLGKIRSGPNALDGLRCRYLLVSMNHPPVASRFPLCEQFIITKFIYLPSVIIRTTESRYLIRFRYNYKSYLRLEIYCFLKFRDSIKCLDNGTVK